MPEGLGVRVCNQKLLAESLAANKYPETPHSDHGHQRRGSNASLSLAMEVARYFELDEAEVREISAQVGKAVSSWRHEATQHGITMNEINRMASAF
jgi:hypothetical protein